MIIQRADSSHKAQIQTLMDELNQYRSTLFTNDTCEFHTRKNPYQPLSDIDFDESVFFLAYDETDTVVGYIQGTIHERKNHKLHTLGYIDELYVRKNARGQGCAKNLFQTLIDEFKNRGCDHITTHTDHENTLSQSLYESIGMKPTTIELWKKI